MNNISGYLLRQWILAGLIYLPFFWGARRFLSGRIRDLVVALLAAFFLSPWLNVTSSFSPALCGYWPSFGLLSGPPYSPRPQWVFASVTVFAVALVLTQVGRRSRQKVTGTCP
jgi:hypothetical protein